MIAEVVLVGVEVGIALGAGAAEVVAGVAGDAVELDEGGLHLSLGHCGGVDLPRGTVLCSTNHEALRLAQGEAWYPLRVRRKAALFMQVALAVPARRVTLRRRRNVLGVRVARRAAQFLEALAAPLHLLGRVDPPVGGERRPRVPKQVVGQRACLAPVQPEVGHAPGRSRDVGREQELGQPVERVLRWNMRQGDAAVELRDRAAVEGRDLGIVAGNAADLVEQPLPARGELRIGLGLPGGPTRGQLQIDGQVRGVLLRVRPLEQVGHSRPRLNAVRVEQERRQVAAVHAAVQAGEVWAWRGSQLPRAVGHELHPLVTGRAAQLLEQHPALPVRVQAVIPFQTWNHRRPLLRFRDGRQEQ